MESRVQRRRKVKGERLYHAAKQTQKKAAILTPLALKLKVNTGIPNIHRLFDVIKMDSDFPSVHSNHKKALLMDSMDSCKTAE